MSQATFISKLVQYSLYVGATIEAKAWLRENAPRLSKDEKIEADCKVVAALEQRYGVEATESKRPEFSGWTFKRDDAKQALYRARDILRGKTVYQAQAAHTDVVAQMAKYASSMRKKHGMTRKQAERAIAQAFAE